MADAKKSTPSAAAGSKGVKKDENVVIKTAHTIRDKVHGFTEDVKEKAHNITHSDDAKKGKDKKKSDPKLPTSSKPPTTANKGPNSSSNSSSDEEDTSKPPPPSMSN